MTVARSYLAIYLNDHLAGSDAALKMLDALAAHDDSELKGFATALRQAISLDREELLRLMGNADVAVSSVRRAVGWVGEKAAELKLRLEDPGDHGLKTFELLEVLALGIEGKRALWSVLRIVSTEVPSLRADYARLAQRADEQRAGVEARRLEWAAKAFTGAPPQRGDGHRAGSAARPA
jgi:hypothetical protein